MTLRLHLPGPWSEGARLELPEAPSRHVQVWRLQPGDTLHLFDGLGVEHEATVLAIGRQRVQVEVGPARTTVPEPALQVTLAVGVPANERMDTLVEKATELGAARLVPLHTERSVLRLVGERARKRREHWQAVAAAASSQCGRAVVPQVEPVQDLDEWLRQLGPGPEPGGGEARYVLSLDPQALSPAQTPVGQGRAVVLSGPEGGLSPGEETAARRAGFVPLGLGPRVLRADTAPLAWLAWTMLAEHGRTGPG